MCIEAELFEKLTREMGKKVSTQRERVTVRFSPVFCEKKVYGEKSQKRQFANKKYKYDLLHILCYTIGYHECKKGCIFKRRFKHCMYLKKIR